MQIAAQIDDELNERLNSAAATTGASRSDLLRQGIIRVVREAEENGSVIFQSLDRREAVTQ